MATRAKCAEVDSERGTVLVRTFEGVAEYVGGPAFRAPRDKSAEELITEVLCERSCVVSR
jgi:hypothetical protein